MPFLEGNGRGNGEKGRDVPRALPLKAAFQHGGARVGVEARVSCNVVAVAPAHHGGVDRFVVFGTDVKKGRTLGRAEPFVAVARVEIGTEGVEIQWNVAGSVGAVDEGENARFPCTAAEFRQGKNQSGGGRDVAQVEHPCPGSDLSPDAFGELLRPKG